MHASNINYRKKDKRMKPLCVRRYLVKNGEDVEYHSFSENKFKNEIQCIMDECTIIYCIQTKCQSELENS